MKALLWQKRWDSDVNLLSYVSFLMPCPFAFPFDQNLLSIFYMQNALKDSKKSETYPFSPGA